MTDDRSGQLDSMNRFTDLWIENQQVVAAFIRLHVYSHHDTEDLLQDVARAAVESFDTYDTSRPFTPWLIGIARRRIARQARQSNRKVRVMFSSEVADTLAQAFSTIMEDADDRVAALEKCVDRLSPRHREVVRMRYSQLLSPDEIAKKVGANRGAINVMMHRVRKALAQCVSKQMGAQ